MCIPAHHFRILPAPQFLQNMQWCGTVQGFFTYKIRYAQITIAANTYRSIGSRYQSGGASARQKEEGTLVRQNAAFEK